MSKSRTSSGARRRGQWHRVYYALALFDVLVVGLGLSLNHAIINTHNEAIEVNQAWETRLDAYLDLGTVAGAVNAPGNDVFDSRDVEGESARRDAALDQFRNHMAAIRRDLRTVSPDHADLLAAGLDRLEGRMADMTAEADLIFGYFDAGRPDLAGSRMAAMDRRYGEVNAAVTAIRKDVGAIQREQLAQQAEHAQKLRDFELLIAAAVIVMITCATAYGHRIKKELETRDAERGRYIAELEASHASLASVNRSLRQEVDARARAEERLRLSEERYALAARGANDGLWDWDLQSGEVYYAPRWKSLLGYGEDDLSTRPGEWLDRVHPDDRTALLGQLSAAMESGSTFELEHRVRHRDGGYRWMLARGLSTTGQGARRLVGSSADVTDRKNAEISLVHDALHDGLTGLPNRVLFLNRLEHALQRARRLGEAPFAVLYVDLDRFKQVNDGLGHLAGDELLVQFAALLQRMVRPGDTAARLGGDEFAILLEGTDQRDNAESVGQRLLTELQKPFTVRAQEVFTSASIGIAIGTSQHSSTTDVLREADAALYRAKNEGRARVQIFNGDEADASVADRRLEMDLRGAISREELHLVYQPIVQLGSGTVVGVEALARWTHPELGPVPPATFIPIAEESGDIAAIGDWVLREACRDMSALIGSAGGPRFVSVNVSPHQLLRRGFADRVGAVLAENGLAPEQLHLEITETSVVRDRTHATHVLERLRVMGVEISIDDFGTGHSALSYVHDLPVDVIKIDRSFVARMTTTGNGAHVVRAILELARGTGLRVVAEGIETEDQWASLVQLGCEYGQGYLFDRPLPLQILVDRLDEAVAQAS